MVCIVLKCKGLMNIFISLPWFHPAYKAGGPIQSIANMVNGLREACGANREGLRRSEILPVAESTVNRFAQQTDVCSTQDDKSGKDDRLCGVASIQQPTFLYI